LIQGEAAFACFPWLPVRGGNGLETLVAKDQFAVRVWTALPFWFSGHGQRPHRSAHAGGGSRERWPDPFARVRDGAAKLNKGEYLEINGANHLSTYTGPVFEQVVARQTAFFKKNLMGQ
jgi:hypothetical protein